MSCSEDAMEVEVEVEPSPSELLQRLTSRLSKLSVCSRVIPSREDFHYYRNFDEFKSPIEQITAQSHSMLDSIASSAAAPLPTDNDDDDDDGAYDWLVDVNDKALERLDMSLDEFKRLRSEQEEGGEFQLVCGKKKKKKETAAASSSSSGLVKTTKSKVSFHVPSIRKPQEEFKILMNNSNQPFQHVWLETTDDGERLVHPLEKLSVDDFIDNADIGDLVPVKPPPIEATPFKLVEEVKDLKELAAKLRSVTEFAVDLEHNQYRSFQGMTCLMQISTRTEDFIVDTLKLRIHVGPYLREVFKDPLKRKVMHGADRDIVWLQRDFGIYVCNMFDTGQASRVLNLERKSLEFLLHHFCDVTANKEYQNADWRFRPLSKEMVKYAREDTHYLLYIYDLMREKLSSMPKESEDSDAPLVEVYKRSYDICMHLYEKEMFTENSYLHIYGLQGACFNSQQLAVVSGLCQWRDVVARTEDESTGYILPNKTLLELAKQMPDTANKLKRLVKSKHPYIEQHLGSVVSVIKNSMQNSTFFEAAAEQLKVEHMETQSENNVMVSDGSGSHLVNGDVSAISPASPTHKEESTECGCDASIGAEKVKSDSDVSVRSTHKIFEGKIGGESSRLQTSPKVTGATVQVQKKPSRAFSALLGSAVPKRKFDADVKVKEQITSSVNSPFHSFSGTVEQSNPKMGKPARGSEVPQPEVSVTVSPAKLSLEYVPVHQENDSVVPAVGMDEPSLSELSSSFKKCLPPLDQNRKAREVKHFDYEAAKKQVIFGEKQSKNVGAGGEGTRNLGSGAKKKSQADSNDGSKELAPGRSRQAFPASGNRSATFR